MQPANPNRVPPTPASAFPGTRNPAIVTDESDKPAQATTQRGPGTVSVTSHDSRPHHAKVEDETDGWEKVEDAETSAPFNSPDEPYSLVLRKPILSSKGAGGKLDTLVLSPPRVDTYVQHGAFVTFNSEMFENKRTGETKKRTWFETDYNKMLAHIAAATGVSMIELRGMSIVDAERAGGILSSMANGMPFR